MASRTSLSAGLTEANIREQLDLSRTPGRSLPVVLFESVADEETPQWRTLSFLLRYRIGGFMVVFPLEEAVSSYLDQWQDGDGMPLVLYQVAEVKMETGRGRYVCQSQVILADFPWPMARHFRRAPSSRASATLGDIMKFQKDDVILRPNLLSAWDASETWVRAQAEEDLLYQEYVTAAEEQEEVEEAPDPEEEAATGREGTLPQGESVEVIKQLQARIEELESRQPSFVAATPKRAPSRDLFPPGTGAGALTDATWAKLQAAAGPSPARLGKFEVGSRAAGVRDTARKTSFLEAEVEAEVVEQDELTALTAEMQDPFHRLMALQLKQNQELLKQMVPKQSDAISHVLAGSGNDSGNSGSGIRGCSAREAFVRQLEDHGQIGRLVLQNAMKELGVTAPYPGIMRDYVERKMPLGEMKLLTMFGYFMAHAWETAYNSQDEVFLGFISRGLLMIEQSAMDGGKTQVGWLLTGLPEPNWALVAQNKKRVGIQPFSRLSQPSWIAANVAFLKDLDFLENRMRAAGSKLGKEADTPSDADKWERPPKKVWPKRKAKGEKPASEAAA